MMRNPLVYGIAYDEKRSDPLLEVTAGSRAMVAHAHAVVSQRRRQDLIIGAAKTLDSVRMARCARLLHGAPAWGAMRCDAPLQIFRGDRQPRGHRARARLLALLHSVRECRCRWMHRQACLYFTPDFCAGMRLCARSTK